MRSINYELFLLYSPMKDEEQHFFIKIYLSLFLESKLLWYVRQTETERPRQIAILTHNFFSWTHHSVLSSRPHLALLPLLGWGTQPEASVDCRPQQSTLSDCKLALTQTLTDSNWQVCICIYSFIMPTTSHESGDCFCLFTQVCL